MRRNEPTGSVGSSSVTVSVVWPEAMDSRWRTVMAFARGPTPVTSGKYDAAGASRSTSPSLTASPIAEAVNVFDREYLWTLSVGRYGSQLVEAMTWPCRMTVSAKGLMPFPSQASTRARIARGSTPCASGEDVGGRYGFTLPNIVPGPRRSRAERGATDPCADP